LFTASTYAPDKIRRRVLNRFRVDRRHPKNTGSKSELIRIKLDVAFGDQLRPFERRLSGIESPATLRDVSEVIGKTTVDILRRRENKNGIAANIF
jgi:hypothetical protein